TEAGQFLTQFQVVEDLAVEGYPDLALSIGHRLGATGDVDDRQPGMGEAHALVPVDSTAVRAAMGHAGDHAGEELQPRRLGEYEHARDAAHQDPVPCSSTPSSSTSRLCSSLLCSSGSRTSKPCSSRRCSIASLVPR